MAKAKFPQYRITQWLDTSKDAMADAVGTIMYGIETRRTDGGQWMKCATRSGPLLFNSTSDAAEVIERFKVMDAKNDNA